MIGFFAPISPPLLVDQHAHGLGPAIPFGAFNLVSVAVCPFPQFFDVEFYPAQQEEIDSL